MRSPRLGFITGMACSVEMESDCSVIKKQAGGSRAADSSSGTCHRVFVETSATNTATTMVMMMMTTMMMKMMPRMMVMVMMMMMQDSAGSKHRA